MFTNILVPLDGTERAEQALPTAACLARAGGGSLTLVRAVPIPVSSGPYVIGPGIEAAQVMEAERDEASDYLAHLSAMPALRGVTATSAVLFGATGPAIVDEVTARHADLVVMTTHGRTGFERWLLGSVAGDLARNAPVPVLVMRAHGPQVGVGAEVDHITRAVIALDGSPLAERAIAPAISVLAAIAGRGKGTIHLAQVVDWEPAQSAEGERADDAATSYLAGVASMIETTYRGVVRTPVTWSAVAHDDAATSLIALAEHGEGSAETGPPSRYDLIAMATHGRSGIKRWALGSVTERVLSTTALPLLVVHAAQTPNLVREG